MFNVRIVKQLTNMLILLASFCIASTYAYAHPPKIAPTLNPKLKPMPEGSYQLAKIVFLPDADESIWRPQQKAATKHGQQPLSKYGISA